MAPNKVGSIPEFTSDASNPEEQVQEEVKQPVEETPPAETDTPEPPAEKPAEAPATEVAPSVDTQVPSQVIPELTEEQRAIAGLQTERVKLLKEIQELKGQRREIKQERLDRVNQQIEELKDVAPEDVSTVEKILRSKGYMTKEEASQMFYQATKQEQEATFFEKYPEYKFENDPEGKNWMLFQSEEARLRSLGWNVPTDPKRIFEAMELIHKNVVKVPSGPAPIAAKRQQIETASHGSGGGQRPSPSGSKFTPQQRAVYENGGWSPEEIAAMEAKLP